MSLAEAYRGLKEAKGTQVPKLPRLVSTPAPEVVSTPAVEGGGGKSPEQRAAGAVSTPAASLPLQGTAKSTHPDFVAVKIFVRRRTHKAAGRKWEDSAGGDFSDLVEKLLSEYLSS